MKQFLASARRWFLAPAFDLWLCGAMLVLAAAEYAALPADKLTFSLGTEILIAAAFLWPVAFRRRHPGLAIAGVAAGGAIASLISPTVWELSSPLICIIMSSYALGRRSEVRAAVKWFVIAIPSVWVISVQGDKVIAGDIIFPSLIMLAPFLIARSVRIRTQLAAELHERAVRLEEERERDAALAVADERRRIAREMHDVVAHSVSVMVVQAGGARRILDKDPIRAREAAELIERTGREALAEMRQLLGLLRPGEAPREPQPGLHGLPGLVRRATEAGLEVELHVEGEERPLPAGIDVAAYRLIQEALTNALKHAGHTQAEVRVAYEDTGLVIEVVDAGKGGGEVVEFPGGHGLIGMRERVAVYGGELHAGPGARGGFEVRARIPLEAA